MKRPYWLRPSTLGLIGGGAAALLIFAACPSNPPSTAGGDLQLFVQRGMNFSNQSCPITYFSWQVDPVTITGSAGTKTSFTKVANPGGGSSVPWSNPIAPFVCNHDQTLGSLASGTWKVTVTTLHNSHNCTVMVPPGGTAKLTWVFNAAGGVESCM